MAATAEALHHRKCPLAAWLSLLEKDGEVRWARHSPEDGDATPNPAVERIAALSPTTPVDPQAGARGAGMNLNHRVAELVSAATNSANLGRMAPGWQAWL